MIINDNTFETFINHAIVKGMTAEDYFKEILLHEVMHFCGSGGGNVLDEGTNELLTRMLAQKYNLRTNSCGYPKEVRLVYELMNQLGEETILKLAFINKLDKQIDFLREKQILEVKSQINKIPNKVSIVSVLFIVPLILLMILGPFIINLL